MYVFLFNLCGVIKMQRWKDTQFILFCVLVNNLTGYCLSAINPACKSGKLFINCNWNEAICNTTWPNRPNPWPISSPSWKTNISSIVLYRDLKAIAYYKIESGVLSYEFAAPFNAELPKILNYTCVWNDIENREQCRKVIVKDIRQVPSEPRNLSFIVYNYHNYPSPAKAFKIQYYFNDSRITLSKNINLSGTASQYQFDVKKCPVAQDGGIASTETQYKCTYEHGVVVCEGLLQWKVLPGIYTAYAVAENSFGSCKSRVYCRFIGNYDKYGPIRSVTVKNLFPVGLNVSWIYPEFLMRFVSSITYSIKICAGEVCRVEDFKRKRTNEIGSFVKIVYGIKHDTNYTIAMQYVINDFWIPEKSPWTKDISIITLSKVPEKLPELLECQMRKEEMVLMWMRENADFVVYYSLLVKYNGKTEQFRFPVANCSQNICVLSYKRNEKQQLDYIVDFSACSNGGCTQAVTSHCYFQRQEKIPVKFAGIFGMELIVVVSIASALLVIAIVVYAVRVALKRQKSGSTTKIIVGPRHHEYNDYDSEPNDFVYDKI